jgi:hypothetical protein
MRVPHDLPELATARVLTPGGPYLAGDTLSLAFSVPTVARLALHGRDFVAQDEFGGEGFVPEAIAVVLLKAAGPFAMDDVVTLSFIDPSIARVHPGSHRTHERRSEVAPHEPAPEQRASQPPLSQRSVPRPSTPRPPATRAAPPASLPRDTRPPKGAEAEGRPRGVRVRLDWNPERARRFVQIVDKLFTVDRLGWYRHALVMRLLVPDEIGCADATAELEATRHLRDLRAASVETLGKPLLAAFMPNFTVSAEWLDSLDRPAAAKALAGLRDTILPHLEDGLSIAEGEREPGWTVGIVERSTFLAAPAGSVEALLPVFVAGIAADTQLTERLTEYRETLLELFAQTAQSADAVRLNAMAQPNHSLDDRLWQLVGTVQTTSVGLAAV